VAECAAIGKSDEDKGQSVVVFVTLEGDDNEGDDNLEESIREHVANKIGKFARPEKVIWAADLPKTRSGKIMRRLLRDIAEGREAGDVTTLKEPGVMDDLASKFDDEEGDSGGGGEGSDAGSSRDGDSSSNGDSGDGDKE